MPQGPHIGERQQHETAGTGRNFPGLHPVGRDRRLLGRGSGRKVGQQTEVQKNRAQPQKADRALLCDGRAPERCGGPRGSHSPGLRFRIRISARRCHHQRHRCRPASRHPQRGLPGPGEQRDGTEGGHGPGGKRHQHVVPPLRVEPSQCGVAHQSEHRAAALHHVPGRGNRGDPDLHAGRWLKRPALRDPVRAPGPGHRAGGHPWHPG